MYIHFMHIQRIDLNLLVVFDAVARTGSVTQAALDLPLSQPAISHALNRLRSAVDDPLFVRSRGQLVLTPKAENMRAPVASLLESARAVFEQERFDAKTATTVFRIGVSDYATLTCIPNVVTALRKAAPLARLELTMVDGRTLGGLESGDVDCTFWGASLPPAPFESSPLFSDRFVGVVCHRHPLLKALKFKKKISLRDYLAYPHAMVALAGTQLSSVDVALAKAGHERRVWLTAPGFASVLSIVKGSDLIASIPMRLAEIQQRKELASFELPITVPAIPYSLVWHRRKAVDAGNAWFRALVQRELASAKPSP